MSKQPDDMKNTDNARDKEQRHPATLSRRAALRAGLGGLGGFGLASLASLAGAGLLAGCAPGSAQNGLRQTPPSPTPTPPTATPSPTPDTRPVSVVITGDIMLARSVGARINASKGLFPFAGIAEALQSHDLRIGNLECVV